jgi:hypothetical protein
VGDVNPRRSCECVALHVLRNPPWLDICVDMASSYPSVYIYIRTCLVALKFNSQPLQKALWMKTQGLKPWCQVVGAWCIGHGVGYQWFPCYNYGPWDHLRSLQNVNPNLAHYN